MTCCNRRRFLRATLAAPLLLIGCGGEQTDAAVPPEIALGRDTCGSCGMIISDERFASALVAADGTVLLYDDLGEMLEAVAAEGLGERRAWAHDWNSAEWTDATTASFVRGAPETTPMGTGFVAFATREDAERFAADGGAETLTWEEATSAES
jgi:copper chaperone NosL